MERILVFAGSVRNQSTNKHLATLAARAINAAGAQSTLIDLGDYELPIYNGDDEAANGIPESAKALKALFFSHHGLFIASPEYNSSFSPLLKNALDWVSRPHAKDELPLAAYRGKVAGLGAVSPGVLGGLRGLVQLRMMLGNIGVAVVPNQIAVPNGYSAFDDNGLLADKGIEQLLDATISQLVATTRAINCSSRSS